MGNNFERMLALVDEVFDVKSDPDQLDVDQSVIERLAQLHPSTLSEMKTDDGPYLWILLIPTTKATMEGFLNEGLSEKGLLEATMPGQIFDAVYLCSATVLQEFRRKGLARNAALAAITQMQSQFPIKALYYWKFSDEGALLANSIGKELGLPVFCKAS